MRAVVLLLAVFVAACDAPPIQWSDPVPVGGSDSASIVIDAGGGAHADGAAREVAPPSVPGLCTRSFRTTQGATELHAAWWGLRKDSSAVLYSASSSDSGRTWSPAVRVDTSDVSTLGCDRPAPSLATVGDDLQLAYSMRALEGTGVFYAHFMGAMVHEPVAVLYGERLVKASVAAEGDRVAVAYEDPNGSRPRVDIALSSTQGHIFEVRTTASRDVDLASAPAVALAGQRVAVAWSTRRAPDSAATRVVRVGRIQ